MTDPAQPPNKQANDADKLARRLAAFKKERAADQKVIDVRGKTGSATAFRLVTELVTGVLMGVGLGWLADTGLGTKPWGVVVGTVLGFGLGFYAAARGAFKLQASTEQADTPQAPATQDDEDDNNTGLFGA